MYGQITMAISLGFLSLFLSLDKTELSLTALVFFQLFFQTGIGGVLLIYLPEITQDDQFGFIMTWHYLNGAEISLATESMVTSMGPSGTFLFYCVVTLCGFFAMWAFVKETQGLSDSQKKTLNHPFSSKEVAQSRGDPYIEMADSLNSS